MVSKKLLLNKSTAKKKEKRKKKKQKTRNNFFYFKWPKQIFRIVHAVWHVRCIIYYFGKCVKMHICLRTRKNVLYRNK